MKVLFLVTARGGSKGIPNKNLAQIDDLPLVAYKIRSALKTDVAKRVICSTDSPEIAAVAERYGAEAPFLRPDELAGDTALSMDVVRHAMQWVADHESSRYDAVMLLEPSTPFATHLDYERAIEMYVRLRAISVVGVREVRPHPLYCAVLGPDGRMDSHYEQMQTVLERRRQDLPRVYAPNGALYLMDWEHVVAYGERYTPRTFGHVMPDERSVEVDEPTDLRYARFLVDSGTIDTSYWKQ